jgi:FkbM family methyltransferase
MELLNTLRFIAEHPLNRKDKPGALFRFVRWQLATRLWNGAIAVNYVNGTRLLVARGMRGATGNIYTGLHEFEDMAFVLHLLKTGDGFVDVGANVGSYTVLAGGAIGARCVSIEPVPETFGHLLDNIRLNGMSEHVSALNIGVGEANGIMRFTSGLDTVNHVATDAERAAGNTTQVPVGRLDDVLADFAPTLIKIDVEGYETHVIAGAHETLRHPSLLGVIMELNGSGERYGFDEAKLHTTMLAYGFCTFTYAPFERELVRLDGKNAGSGNTLYIRNVDEVLARLASAPKFTTNNGWKI